MDRSPLGALSPELRNRIYELALYERRPVSISKNFWAEAALLRTCKQVRQEAELLFYSINDCIFVTDLQENEDWKRLLHWVQRAPTQKFALIKSFTVQVETPGRELPWYCRRCGSGDGSSEDVICQTLYKHSFGDRQIAEVVRVSVHGVREDQFLNTVPGSDEVEEFAERAVIIFLKICTGDDVEEHLVDLDEMLGEVERLKRLC